MFIWPSLADVNTRARRLVSAWVKHQKREEQKQVHLMKVGTAFAPVYYYHLPNTNATLIKSCVYLVTHTYICTCMKVQLHVYSVYLPLLVLECPSSSSSSPHSLSSDSLSSDENPSDCPYDRSSSWWCSVG